MPKSLLHSESEIQNQGKQNHMGTAKTSDKLCVHKLQMTALRGQQLKNILSVWISFVRMRTDICCADWQPLKEP